MAKRDKERRRRKRGNSSSNSSDSSDSSEGHSKDEDEEGVDDGGDGDEVLNQFYRSHKDDNVRFLITLIPHALVSSTLLVQLLKDTFKPTAKRAKKGAEEQSNNYPVGAWMPGKVLSADYYAQLYYETTSVPKTEVENTIHQHEKEIAQLRSVLRLLQGSTSTGVDAWREVLGNNYDKYSKEVAALISANMPPIDVADEDEGTLVEKFKWLPSVAQAIKYKCDNWVGKPKLSPVRPTQFED